MAFSQILNRSPNSIRSQFGGAPPQQQEVQALQPAQTGGEELLRLIEQTTDSPIGQELVRGILQQEIGVRIPSRQELALQQAQLQAAQIKIRKEQRQQQVKDTLSLLIDRGQDDAGEALYRFAQRFVDPAIDPTPFANFQGQSLEDLLAGAGTQIGTLDANLVQDPRRLRAASQVIGGLFDDMLETEGKFAEDFEIGFGDLIDFDITREGATTTPEDLQREELGKQVRAQGALEAKAKFITGVIEGDSDLGKLLEGVKDDLESRFDVDLDTGFFGFGDLDTELGAQVFAGDFVRFIESRSPDKSTAADLSLALFREKEVGDIIERDSQIQVDPESGEAVIVDAGPVASIYLRALEGFARQGGLDFANVAAQIGLPATRVSSRARAQGALSAEGQ